MQGEIERINEQYGIIVSRKIEKNKKRVRRGKERFRETGGRVVNRKIKCGKKRQDRKNVGAKERNKESGDKASKDEYVSGESKEGESERNENSASEGEKIAENSRQSDSNAYREIVQEYSNDVSERMDQREYEWEIRKRRRGKRM